MPGLSLIGDFKECCRGDLIKQQVLTSFKKHINKETIEVHRKSGDLINHIFDFLCDNLFDFRDKKYFSSNFYDYNPYMSVVDYFLNIFLWYIEDFLSQSEKEQIHFIFECIRYGSDSQSLFEFYDNFHRKELRYLLKLSSKKSNDNKYKLYSRIQKYINAKKIRAEFRKK